MKLHADFSKRVEINTNEMEWIASPAGGVDRKMLDRIGDEKARATSIVRYAADSAFPEHEHPLGEEFYVLEGVFSDEHGDYPAGTYVRNPDGTRHSPFSKDGCTILVKLRQFEQTDDRHFSISTATADWKPRGLPGLSVIHLHEHETETV
ncbi:MAG: cupin domain-containing protein, partial [Pseudomonadota bacterium]|nr:cupin domain-containing protein [Pseudomonadota bacterium]